MTQTISQDGLDLIEKWEECVLFVYDDKVPKRRIGGHLQYPEWNGWKPRGTLTIGFGHTDAAGAPKVERGLRIEREEANEILRADLAPCQQNVRRCVKVPLTQHQFDALVSFTFNCGAGNLRKLIVSLNKGDYDSIPRKLMMYVTSKGERMRGLVNRRAAEISLWNKPDDADEAERTEVFSPKGEENDAPKSIAESKTGNSAVALGGGSAVVSIAALNDAAEPIKQAVGNAKELGLVDYISPALHSPIFLVAIGMVGLAVFVWWDRYRKLEEDHV